MLPNRHGSTDTYRYGFQGQEKDDEIKGVPGSSLNYKYRMHDPRVGRFFATDPLERRYPYYSTYQFSGNRVIDVVELEGLEPGLDWWWIVKSMWYGYKNKLKVARDDALKDIYQGSTNSNESINENPVYSPQRKDNEHTMQKISGQMKLVTTIIDPAVQVMNTVSPVDDLLTVSTGQIYDVVEVREATGWERFWATVEVVSFIFDTSVLAKPTQKIISESGEEIVENASKEIVEESIEPTVKIYRAVGINEYNDIIDNKIIRPEPTGKSMEAKLFSSVPEDAYQQGIDSGKDFRLIVVEITESMYDKLFKTTTIDEHITKGRETIAVYPEEVTEFNINVKKIDATEIIKND